MNQSQPNQLALFFEPMRLRDIRGICEIYCCDPFAGGT
jgi:hypothetical protein